MGDYNRTVWKDHIKDQNGNVIQQGTPVSAQNLNNIENQVIALSAKENTLAELVREQIPSGFTTLSDLDYSYMSTNPNTIKLSSDSVAYVNGYKVVIPAGTIITLDAPPTAGSRDDLVFLEVYKLADANGAEQLNWRLRVVDGVDFNKYNTDGFCVGNSTSVADHNTVITPQGGASLPIPIGTSDSYIYQNMYRRASNLSTSAYTALSDIGVYVAGKGDVTSKSILGTVDGYVYAIPMFKVHRRNSGGYSVNNGNGAVNRLATVFTDRVSPMTICGNITDATVSTGVYDRIKVGDIFWYNNGVYKVKVIALKGNNIVTIQSTKDASIASGVSSISFVKIDRVDSLLADIIAERDIIDLRHKVSLTGFNYQQLLEDNFDKLLRGDLQTSAKTAMLKTYHGTPKTPIDANHVFYVSLDGTTTAEVGGTPYTVSSGIQFANSTTGLGFLRKVDSEKLKYSVNLNKTIMEEFTIDSWFNLNGNTTDGQKLFELINSENAEVVGPLCYLLNVRTNSGKLLLTYYGDTTPTNSVILLTDVFNPVTPHHLRLTFKNGAVGAYLDGKLTLNYTSLTNNTRANGVIKYISIGSDFYYASRMANGVISDFSVSNIDRGSDFATLPQDFIDGYARISNAFNGQRQVFSDALTSQYKLELVKANGSNKKQITTTQGTSNQWTTGDTIKVKGLGGEIISGVIDTDTALARVIATSATVISDKVVVDSVGNFSVNDTFRSYNITTGAIHQDIFTITAIDTATNTLTVTPNFYNDSNSRILIETTTSSSSPTVKANASGTAQAGASNTITLPSTFNATDDVYNNLDIMITAGTGAGQRRTISDYVGSTKVATVSSAWTTNPDATSVFTIYGVPVAGTWSGLGTNQATFTLGTLYALSNQDIQIEYSLNQVAGQGGISEVLTTTLAGECNGKKLALNPTVHIRDDYKNKTAGDLTVCPNSAYTVSSSALQAPTAGTWNEFAQGDYTNSNALDGTFKSVSTTVNGEIPQIRIKKNIIRMIEDKIGNIPAIDKIKWAKDNINSITVNAYVFGSCSSGNKVYLTGWQNSSATWNITPSTATNGSVTDLSFATLSTNGVNNPTNMIDSSGFINYLLYTDQSDGVTPSQVNLDYAYLDIVLKTPTGYDVLAPENPRRDDGKSNILLVRKETKEIQCFMDCTNTDGIVSYGDYVPYQQVQTNITALLVYLRKQLLVSTSGTGGVPGSLIGIKYACLSDRLPKPNGFYNYLLSGTDIHTTASVIDIYNVPINQYRINDNLLRLEGTPTTVMPRVYSDTKLIASCPHIVVLAGLVLVNNQLYLRVAVTYSVDNIVYSDYSTVSDFNITNRPLIK